MGITLDEVVLDFASSSIDVSGSEVSLDAATLAALENITVSATDLDIRDLAFATDKVDASGSEVSLDAATLAALENITVSATDLDIRDLTFANDKVDASGSEVSLDAATLAALETITVIPPEYTAMKNSAESVGTTAAQVLSTPLSGRAELTIQNEGSQPVYMGFNASVTAANGIKISKNSSATYDIPDGVDVFMIAASGTQDVRFFGVCNLMFTDRDKIMHRGLMKLLDEATFDLKAREVKAFLAVYEWARTLPDSKPQVIKKTIKKRNK